MFLGVTAGFDWFLQRQRFMNRMRMTLQEIKEEFKQADGDPHIKGKRKQCRCSARASG
jgi:flagellar biosynthetic protein FlhB